MSKKVIEEVKQAKNEILDYRRVYPMTYRCRDGHYVRSKSEKMIDDMLGNMVPFMKQQMTVKSQDAESKEKFDKFVDFLMDEMRVLSNTLLNEEMVGIYDRNFTHDEILDLIAFYESPTGKKLIEKNPVITAELLQVMQTKFIPQFQEVVGRKMKEFQP